MHLSWYRYGAMSGRIGQRACASLHDQDKPFWFRSSSEHLNRFFGRPRVELRPTFTMQSAMMTKNALRAGATSKSAGARGRASVRVLATSRVDRCSKSEIMVAPSILSANFARLGEQVRAVN